MDECLMHEDNVIILNYYIFVSDVKDSWTIYFFGEILKPNEAEGYRGLAQHGDPPSWLEEIVPVVVILWVMDGPYIPPAFFVPYQFPWQELFSCKRKEFPAAVI